MREDVPSDSQSGGSDYDGSVDDGIGYGVRDGSLGSWMGEWTSR